MAKKKGTVKKIVSTLLGLAVIAGASVLAYNEINKNTPTPPTPPAIVQQLETPTDVSYDIQNYVLSWDDVDNATGYVVSYNGTTYNVEDNSKHILPTAEENVFKVKAVGDNIDYSDSEWSSPITYTITNTEENVFDSVNIQLAQTAAENDLTLVEVIGISYADMDKTSFGTNLSFEVICNNGSENVNARISYGYDDLDTIGEMLQSIDSYTKSSLIEYDIVNYNSAEELLLSNSFDGKMEELRQQGYEFSVMDSCVREGSKSGSSFRFSIVGTYKAEKDGDVKYFTSVNDIKIHNASKTESNNYVTSVGYVEDRTVTESYFVEHTNDTTYEYMQGLVSSTANAEVFANQYVSYTYNPTYNYTDDGREN